MECIIAYKSDASFVVSILKTQAEKLELIVPYFTLILAFQSSRSKEILADIPQPSSHNDEVLPISRLEWMIEEATP